MSDHLADIKRQLLQLSFEDRFSLLEHLLLANDSGQDEDWNDDEWKQELRRRLKKNEQIPAGTAIRKLREEYGMNV